ncbi:MAG TPA: hypothetical protein VGS01_09735, partial [Candidatus Limnocylindria bacterium]|nr:hypothetical protein [Candidatus Limnocylindria bacterium]
MPIDLARAPVPLRPPDGRPSDQYLINFRDAMIDRYRDRNSDFETLVNAWHGSLYSSGNRAWNMDSAGKPILRDSSRGMGDQPSPHNIYKGFVDAYKRALVALPDVRIPRQHGRFGADLDGQKQAEQWAERMRRAAYGAWAASQMDVWQVMSAWWLTVCGSHGELLWPDFDRGIPLIKYTAPWDIYGVGKLGDPIALSRCIVSVEEDPLVIAGDYPDEAERGNTRPRTDLSPAGSNAAGSEPDATRAKRHSIYYDENWFAKMIGDEVVERDYHGLGFCPALISPLIMLPGFVNRGHSVAEQALPMQYSIDYGVNLWEAGMKDAIFKTAYVKDPINVPDNWARGKGMLITLTAEGEVGEFGGDPQALNMVKQHFELMRTMMEINTGVSRAAQSGQMGGSIQTGRGIEKSQGPYLASVEEIQTVQSIFMSRMLLYWFAAASNHEYWDELEDSPVKIEGYIKRQSVYETFTRKELKDVKAVEIVFAPMAHLGLHERVNIALQLYNTKPPILSWQRIIEITGLVDDIEELRAQIESDNAWRNQIMRDEVAAQQPAEPGGGGAQGDPTQADAARQAGATNVDTLRRAGAVPTPARPGTPGAQIPAAGAPTGRDPSQPPDNGDGSGLTDQQVLDPAMLQKVFGEPPAEPSSPLPTGLGRPGKGGQSVEETLRSELATVQLHGDAYLVGKNKLLVDWRDKKA